MTFKSGMYNNQGKWVSFNKKNENTDNVGEFDYQKRMGEFLDDVVPQFVLDSVNEEKGWEYGYNEEYDIVIVSKDGTLGQVYVLDGLRIGLPKEPEDKSKILGHDLPTIDQKWKPFEIPKELLDIEREAIEWNSNKANKNNPKTPTEIFYSKTPDFVEKYTTFINEDFDRREFGVWQYINGKAVWIVGSHYFMLQHIPVHGTRLPDFRFSNLDMYLFWEACKADYRSLGMIKVKGRREGASTMAGGEVINISTQTEEGFFGIMSKTNRDSESFLMRMVVRPFKKLGWWIKPTTSGTTTARSGLVFKELIKRISSTNTVMSGDSGLDTLVRQFPTSINSMDGERVDMAVLDEAAKILEFNFEEYFPIVATCLTEGFKIIGKAMVFSTVNAMDKGGRNFKNVYTASNINERTESGRTASGLYSLFMPACWTMEGGYDVYGYSVVEDPASTIKSSDGGFIKIGNKRRIEEDGAAKKKISDVLYNEHLRQYPLILSHAFRDEAKYSDFNLNKIYEQIDFNNGLGKNFIERVDIEKGNFINKSKDPNKYDIEFVPSGAGRFLVSWLPPEDMRNGFELRGGEYYPKHEYGCFGIDPYRIQKTADPKRGSMAAMSGVTGMSFNADLIPSNEFFLEYLNRPATISTFFDDMIFSMLYYGIPVLAERNVSNFLEELKKRGMTRFSLRRRDVAKLTPDDKRLGGWHMNDESAQKHYYAIQSYIEKYIGIDDEGLYRDKGQEGIMPFNRTLESWSQFRPDNRTTQDLSISSGLAIAGINMMQGMNKVNQASKNSVKQIQSLFPVYDYSSR